MYVLYCIVLYLYCIVFVFVLYCNVYVMDSRGKNHGAPCPKQSIEARSRGPRAQPFRRGVVTVRCGPPSGGFFMVQSR